jgi:hypothetical protein
LADDNKTLFCAHKYKTLTMNSLTAGNISSALCSIILATLVARECTMLCNHTTQSSYVLWAAKEFVYMNPSDIASYF